MKRIIAGCLFSCALTTGLWAESSAPDSSAKTEQSKEGPRVQIALLLDTSGSMEGLISQAKQQLWQIVNEFISAKQDGKTPQIEVALFEYGNSGLSAENGWIRCISPLSQDLDLLSEKLFALSTNGGDEYCGWVIRDATKQLNWNSSPKVYKAIFIAGNEPFTQGPVSYRESCKAAVERGIIVNTIHCGEVSEGINGEWKEGAAIADGKFLVIDHNAQVASIPAPQDTEIAELNRKLNDTYLGYGAAGAAGKSRQSVQDANAVASPGSASVAAARAQTKASKNYSNGSWDLVDAVRENKADLSKMKEDDLPEELKNVEPSKRAAVVEAKRVERENIQKRLMELSTARQKFIAGQTKSSSNPATLDRAMISAIREQAHNKQFQFEE